MGQNKTLKLIVKVSLFVVPIITIAICLAYNVSELEDKITGYGDATIIINEVVTDNLCGLENEYGTRCDWIELYNCTNEDINIDGYSLSDSGSTGKTKFEDVTIKANDYLIVYADSMESHGDNVHVNFSIGASGDELYLNDSNGITIDRITIPEVGTDMAYGRRNGALDSFGIFSYATPGYENQYEFLSESKEYLTDVNVEFSYESGFYDSEFELTLTCNDNDALILYTLDGSEPSVGSKVYTKPLKITDRENDENQYVSSLCVPFEAGIYTSYASGKVNKSNVIRARVYKDGKLSEKIWTKNYFIDKDYNLPVISISVSPYKMFDDADGIYMPGKMYFFSQRMNLSDHYAYGNYSLKESLKSNITIFDEKGTLIFESNAKLRLAGNSGKQTSILKNLRFNNVNKDLPDLYETLGAGYESSELSIKGTGGWPTYMHLYQNAYINNAIYDMEIGAQKNIMSVVFMDGEFWGLYSISEQKNEEYFNEHYSVDATDLVAIDNGELKYGNSNDYSEYIELYEEFEKRDFTNATDYEWAKSQIDMDNYMEYMISMMYFDNLDWPDNNVILWKSTKENGEGYNDGRWRFFIYDLDHTFEDYNVNSFERIMNFDTENDDKYILIPVIVLTKLWNNNEFKQDFVNKMKELFENELSEEKLLTEFDKHIAQIEPYINVNISRTTGNGTFLYNAVLSKIGSGSVESYDSWTSNVEYIKEYIDKRSNKMINYVEEYDN